MNIENHAPGDSHSHSHPHDTDGHAHRHSGSVFIRPTHNHDSALDRGPSRRDILRVLTGGFLAGASILELAWHRAAWARSVARGSESKLFDIQRVADGVFFAHARAQAMVNCNAAIFVRSKDVLVVDAHSKPSAAASLIAQIEREVTAKPVRYVVNTHFHLTTCRAIRPIVSPATRWTSSPAPLPGSSWKTWPWSG